MLKLTEDKVRGLDIAQLCTKCTKWKLTGFKYHEKSGTEEISTRPPKTTIHSCIHVYHKRKSNVFILKNGFDSCFRGTHFHVFFLPTGKASSIVDSNKACPFIEIDCTKSRKRNKVSTKQERSFDKLIWNGILNGNNDEAAYGREARNSLNLESYDVLNRAFDIAGFHQFIKYLVERGPGRSCYNLTLKVLKLFKYLV